MTCKRPPSHFRNAINGSPAHFGGIVAGILFLVFLFANSIFSRASAAERSPTSVSTKTAANWWSLRPLKRPKLPDLSSADQQWVRNPIDAFLISKLRDKGLSPSPEADRRTLIRRLYFDLIGLPPPPDEVRAFVADSDPKAYEKLVDRLMASPHYGERWARHWLDVVHYGDTHGYDKDKPRPNAWPYRDYVIRSFNQDKPYERFVKEQIAGDVLFPGEVEPILATGFIATGPWDFIGHAELPETKIDGQIARHLDRDDMVATTMNTFVSLTVQCAQCHDHKFDPISQEDYYSLQAVFAALDRADRPYDEDSGIGARRAELQRRRNTLTAEKSALEARITGMGGKELAELEKQLKAESDRTQSVEQPEFGYHSQIEKSPDVLKWVQIDLGQRMQIDKLVFAGCHDNFNNIGAGFGFPARFKIEISDDAACPAGVAIVSDHTAADYTNPGTDPQTVQLNGQSARYVRFTATKLAPRQDDYIFALAELSAFDATGKNLALKADVTALDSIEAPPRWQRKNLVDGYYYGMKRRKDDVELTRLRSERQSLLDRVIGTNLQRQLAVFTQALAEVNADLGKLPKAKMVFAGTVHFGNGNFRGTGPDGGKPRPIHLLERGNVRNPKDVAEPGAVEAIGLLEGRFHLEPAAPEGARRMALANWICDPRNPLTWRSIVNRVWLYHFGRGLVDSPSDFGRMGQMPTHPELLDWLAAEFRDGGQSIKELHRLLVNSATYRQGSALNPAFARVDSENKYLWRMNRQRLDAEAIRDSVLWVARHLDHSMFGPGFQDFVVEKPEHSPHYEYHLHDPEDPRSHRRSIYRFIVRSQQQPFMTVLDCADPSMQVDKRNETLTALQALSLLNNKFMLTMAKHFAARLEHAGTDTSEKVKNAVWLALGRAPSPEERSALANYAQQYGMSNLCRVILNLNEFIFVD